MLFRGGGIRPPLGWLLLAAVLIAPAEGLGADKPSASDDARERAAAEVKAGKLTNAVTIISDALRADPKDGRLWNFRAQVRSLAGDHSGAVTDLSEGLRISPDSPFLYQERAIERFRIGQVPESLADFDRANELSPDLVPYNWQRGIALYYGRRFTEGRKQFEQHRTVNPNDVENAVWHFLCVARSEGTNAAHQAFMPITGDPRVPMAEIHDLFAGEAPPSEVWEAAETVSGTPEEQRQARFHALLYLGLYADVMGRPDEARNYLKQGVKLAVTRDLMGDVARLQLARLGETTDSSKP